MSPGEARFAHATLVKAHSEISILLDKWREEHVDDDWFGYAEVALGDLRAAFGSPIPAGAVTRTNG